jgi:hypothetical protein
MTKAAAEAAGEPGRLAAVLSPGARPAPLPGSRAASEGLPVGDGTSAALRVPLHEGRECRVGSPKKFPEKFCGSH